MTQGEEALKVFLKNASWREYYEKAPSDACRKAIEGEFVRSLNTDYGTAYEKGKLEAVLGPEDWKWLYRWCGNNRRKQYIARKIEETGGDRLSEQTTGEPDGRSLR